MENQLTPGLSNDTVTVKPEAGEWRVVVHESGHAAAVDFLLEEHANSFAEGQRQRLKLDAGDRRR